MAIPSHQTQLVAAFGILGNVISVLVYLAPLPTFYRIYKKKSTESFQSLPYQMSLLCCMHWLYYAMVKGKALPLITINSFGCVVQVLYIASYVAYATKEKRVAAMKLFLIMNVTLFSLVLLVTTLVLGDAKIRLKVLGWICVAITVCVYVAPLNVLARVVRTRSVEFMPFTLSFFLTLSAVMWSGYGLLLADIYIAIPNGVGVLLGVLQMALYANYRIRSQKLVKTEDQRKQQTTEELRTIVVLSESADVQPDAKKNQETINQKEPEGKELQEEGSGDDEDVQTPM